MLKDCGDCTVKNVRLRQACWPKPHGYIGGGCTDFALNVLIALYPEGKGENVKIWRGHVSWRAWTLHQDFKVKFLASANRDEGRIPWAKITKWIEAQRDEMTRN